MQAYCYLTEFADRPVSDEKLSLLQESFDNLRRRGLKAVLRFAYERDMGLKEGPTLDWILRHIDQLQPLLRRNVDVIYVLQAGFIGAWGEWHSAARIAQDDYVARAAIIKRLLEALPEERMLQVRVPKYKRLALTQPALAAMVEVGEQNAFYESAGGTDRFSQRRVPGGPFGRGHLAGTTALRPTGQPGVRLHDPGERVRAGGRRAVLVRPGFRRQSGPRQGRGRSQRRGADAAASLQQLQPGAQLLGAGRPALLD